jgi:hypothetical protein
VLRRILGTWPNAEASRSLDPPRGSVDLLCLAFSRKYGGRCVAGLNLADGTWVRPVSDQEYGTLYPRNYLLPDGNDPQVLDVLTIGLSRPVPEPHQPENHLVSAARWQRVWRSPEEVSGVLTAAVDRRPLLFATPGDRIRYQEAQEHPLASSLTLVAPADVSFVSTSSYAGNPQAKARFRHGQATYFLAVTDPHWEFEIAGRAEGRYSPRQLGLDEGRILFTISLGEPFNGDCFKLIAAIFEAPRAL